VLAYLQGTQKDDAGLKQNGHISCRRAEAEQERNGAKIQT
jgi:hypothetical protein